MNDQQRNKWNYELQVDRWVLGVLFTIVLGFSGYSYNNFSSKVDGLQESVNTLSSNMGIMGEQMKDVRRLEDRLDSLETRMLTMEVWAAEQRGRFSEKEAKQTGK